MTKVMVVEDDQSLREIYSIRLTAEGYEIVSAGDGEEALALAVKERPDLILSDVRMTKISGFDMLDILRQTPETKDIKVIMMTALSSDDQRKRGEGLGADKYLIKSQVGIEDVIAAVHEVLGEKATKRVEASATAAETTSVATPEAPAAGPIAVAEQPAAEPVAVAEQPITMTEQPAIIEQPVATEQPVAMEQPMAQPVTQPMQPQPVQPVQQGVPYAEPTIQPAVQPVAQPVQPQPAQPIQPIQPVQPVTPAQ